jgi:hypothetical protein
MTMVASAPFAIAKAIEGLGRGVMDAELNDKKGDNDYKTIKVFSLALVPLYHCPIFIIHNFPKALGSPEAIIISNDNHYFIFN